MNRIQSFKDALRRCSERERDPIEEEERIKQDAKEHEQFKLDLDKVGGYDTIPQICFVEKENDVGKRWKTIALLLHERERCHRTWDEDSLSTLWTGLSDEVLNPSIDGITFQQFQKVGIKVVNQIYDDNSTEDQMDVDLKSRLLEARGTPVLSASHFLLLSSRFADDKGKIPIRNIFDFYRHLAYILRTESEVLHYSCGRNFLTEENLEEYITSLLLGDVQVFKQIPEERIPYDSCVLAKRILHQLNSTKRRRVRVDEFLNSKILRDLIQVQLSNECDSQWLEEQEVIYNRYLNWMDETLAIITPQCLKDISLYNDLFVDRSFEVFGVSSFTYTNFVIFQLACEDLNSDNSFSFLWKVLDLHCNGEVTPMVVQAFLKHSPSLNACIVRVKQSTNEEGSANDEGSTSEEGSTNKEGSLIENVVLEIFDIINPVQPLCIRQSDLRSCGLRETIFRILFMSVGFELHEMKSINPDKFVDHPKPKPPKRFNVPDFR